MKIIVFVNIMLFASMLNAQSIKLEYEVTINSNTYIQTRKSIYNLLISNNKSIYYNDGNDIDIFTSIDWKPEVVYNKNGIKSIKIDDGNYATLTQDFFYKDYKKNSMLYNDYINKQKIIIAEKIALFQWEIVPETDTIILNYHCQKAIADFRGRKYEAYFSKDAFYYGGPWKFDGLPGLILFVKSTDDFFILRSLKLEIVDKSENIENPYKNEKKISSWDEFKINNRKEDMKILKMLQADARHGESSRIIIKNRIEYLGYYELSSDDL